MARQIGHIFITGTIHDVTYYKMDGTYYARMKSSLSRKTVLTSPRFTLTRMHANQLAEASRIASQLYRMIPKEQRKVQLYRAIVSQAKILLASGKDKESVSGILSHALFPQSKKIKLKPIKKKPVERIYLSKAGRLVWKNFNDNSNETTYKNRTLLDPNPKESMLSTIQSNVLPSEKSIRIFT